MRTRRIIKYSIPKLTANDFRQLPGTLPANLKGDFAAGLRTTPKSDEWPAYARGQELRVTVREGPDFARGQRTQPPVAEGPDYARGLH